MMHSGDRQTSMPVENLKDEELSYYYDVTD